MEWENDDLFKDTLKKISSAWDRTDNALIIFLLQCLSRF